MLFVKPHKVYKNSKEIPIHTLKPIALARVAKIIVFSIQPKRPLLYKLQIQGNHQLETIPPDIGRGNTIC